MSKLSTLTQERYPGTFFISLERSQHIRLVFLLITWNMLFCLARFGPLRTNANGLIEKLYLRGYLKSIAIAPPSKSRTLQQPQSELCTDIYKTITLPFCLNVDLQAIKKLLS